MPEAPILAGPRHGWCGALLDQLAASPWIGHFFARAQRVRRKRNLESICLNQGPPNGVLKWQAAQDFDNALQTWSNGPSTPVHLPAIEPVTDDPAYRCSVIINTVDRADELERTLGDLARGWRDNLDEIIVVLGPSNDGSRAIASRSFLSCRIIDCPERNLALSRNLGLGSAKGQYVAYLDDDASPCENWLESLLAPLESKPDCGVSAGFAMDGSGDRFLTRYVVSDPLGDSIWMDTHGEAEATIEADTERFLTATGCNMAFRRDQILDLGGFDPFYAYFLEETDLVIRLQREGFRCIAAPESIVLHRQGANVVRSPAASLSARLRIIRSQLHFVRKFALASEHPGRIHSLIWRRVLKDLERIAWEHPRQTASLQNEYFSELTREIDVSSSS